MADATSGFDGPPDNATLRYEEPAVILDQDYGGLQKKSRVGNFLIFLTSADRAKIGSYSERQRYITVGSLMIITAAQGFYAASLFAAVGFQKPFIQVLGFGLFFAAAVYLIDRSIIGYVAPGRPQADGTLVSPPKFTPLMVIRLLIATAAAVLMSEMVLLQFFAPDINAQILSDHLAQTRTINNQVTETSKSQIGILQGQIDAAQKVVARRQAAYGKAEHQANCQEFGCPAQGIVGGRGPGFTNAERSLHNAFAALQQAQHTLTSVTRQNEAQISRLNEQRREAIASGQHTITKANALLTREEAFWQLTVEHGTVAFWRIMLTLLILGIDLAPILAKITGKPTVHDLVVRNEYHVASEWGQGRMHTRTLEHVGRERLQRERDGTAVETELQRLLADAEVDRFGIKLNADLAKRRLHGFYMSGRSRARGRRADTAPFTTPARPGGRDGRESGDQDGRPAEDGRAAEESRAAEETITLRHEPGGPGTLTGDRENPPTREAPFSYEEEVRDEYEEGIGGDSELGIAEDLADIIFGNSWEGLVLGGRWALQEPMADADVGAGGVVWRARDITADTGWYVVKTISAEVGESPEDAANLRQRSFNSEKRIQKISSHHIGEIVDFGKDKNFYYLVYPMYKPGSLSLYCRRSENPWTLRWCVSVVSDILAGLIDASEHGVVHLDIKPGNVVLDGRRARIIDWGLSRMWQATDSTYTAVPRGSPFFACPEQLQRSAPGWDKPTSDLYGAGAVFYWLITGEPPLRQDVGDKPADLMDFMRLIVAGVRPQPVCELVPGVPPALSALIDQWLSYDPASRVPAGTPQDKTMQAARESLLALEQYVPPMTVGAVTGRRRPPRP